MEATGEVQGNRDAREARHEASESQKRQGTTEARRRRGEDYLDHVERPFNKLFLGDFGPLELFLHGRTIPAGWCTNEQVTVMYTPWTCTYVGRAQDGEQHLIGHFLCVKGLQILVTLQLPVTLALFSVLVLSDTERTCVLAACAYKQPRSHMPNMCTGTHMDMCAGRLV